MSSKLVAPRRTKPQTANQAKVPSSRFPYIFLTYFVLLLIYLKIPLTYRPIGLRDGSGITHPLIDFDKRFVLLSFGDPSQLAPPQSVSLWRSVTHIVNQFLLYYKKKKKKDKMTNRTNLVMILHKPSSRGKRSKTTKWFRKLIKR